MKTKSLFGIAAAALLLSFLLSFSACGQKPGENTGPDNLPPAPYEASDYSVRFVRSVPRGNVFGLLYHDAFYSTDMGGLIVGTQLGDLDPEITNGKKLELLPDDAKNYVCPDPLCDCKKHIFPPDCPTYIVHDGGPYLIDPHESAGSYPVFYLVSLTPQQIALRNEPQTDADPFDIPDEEEEETTDVSSTLYRYDSASGKRTEVITLDQMIHSIAVYDQLLFLVHSDVEGRYGVTVAEKSGRILQTALFSDEKLGVVGYDHQRVYIADVRGVIYRIDLTDKTIEQVFTVPGFAVLGIDDDFNRIFIHDGYLYFDSKTETVDYVLKGVWDSDWSVKVPMRTVGRIPLADFSSPVETVAENVYNAVNFGVCGNAFYYAKFEPEIEGKYVTGCYMNFTGGNIYKTDLTTLETSVFAQDTGLQPDACYYFDENFMITLAAQYDNRYGAGREAGSFNITIYDFRTGKVFWINQTDEPLYS